MAADLAERCSRCDVCIDACEPRVLVHGDGGFPPHRLHACGVSLLHGLSCGCADDGGGGMSEYNVCGVLVMVRPECLPRVEQDLSLIHISEPTRR